MALKTPMRLITRRIAKAIRGFTLAEGWAENEVSIAGTFDEPTERFYLVVGSNRLIDESRWFSGIINALRLEFADMPWIRSQINLVIRNVSEIDQVYSEMIVGEGESDVTDMF
jgi:hypothetical protein